MTPINSQYTAGTPASSGGSKRDIADSLVREELDRVLKSEIFQASARMSRFLGYVVESALENRLGDLKETCIAVAVYDREPTYDPKVDPVVRSEARRLRQKLEQYYSTRGKDNPVRISLPKGGYTPSFEAYEAPAPPSTDPPLELLQSGSSFALPARAGAKEEKLSKQYRHLNIVVFSAALLTISLVAAWMLLRHTSRTVAQLAPAKITPLTSFPGQAFQPSISPDGKKIAFVWDETPGNFNIYVMQPGGSPLRVTTDTAYDLHPAWSPDGLSLAFLRSSLTSAAIMTVAFPGGAEREVLPVLDPSTWNGNPLDALNDVGPAWTADGSALIVADRNFAGHGYGLSSHNLKTGMVQRLTLPPEGESDVCPAISPDGKWLAFERFSSNSSADIYIVPSRGGVEQRLTRGHFDLQGISWLPDSRHLLFSSNLSGAYGLWTVSLDGGTPKAMVTSGEDVIHPSVSRNGKLAVYADWNYSTNIVRAPLSDEKGIAPTEIVSSSRRSNSAQFSPDGQRIAFTSDRTGTWEIWTASADGSNPMKLTDFNGPMVGTPRWSPDGHAITFDARTNGHSAIFWITAEGGTPKRLDDNNFEEKQPFWSRDGKSIYFDSNRSGHMQIWRLPVAGGPAFMVSNEAGYDTQQSKDGRFIYFADRGARICQVPSSGGKAELLPGMDRLSSLRLWFVATSGIYFVGAKDNYRELEFYDFQTHHIREVRMLPSPAFGGTPSLSVSPDGRWVLFTRKDQEQSNLMLVEPTQPISGQTH